MVAEINHRVPHHFHALFPLPALGVLFLVARRADLDNAGLVARGHVHALRRNVHPAEVIRMRAANQVRVEVVHPIGIRLAEAGPVVRRTLRVAG